MEKRIRAIVYKTKSRVRREIHMTKSRLASFCEKTRRSVWGFRRDTRGVTTIEFAFIIGPFLAITLGTMEVAMIHLMRSSVSNAVESAARPIYTGAAGCATIQTVKEQICSRIGMQSEDNCMGNLKVILEELDDFDGERTAANADFDSIDDFVEPGGAESTMLLRTYYQWEVLFPLLEKTMGGDDGKLLLTATTAFKNEPFGSDTGCQS